MKNILPLNFHVCQLKLEFNLRPTNFILGVTANWQLLITGHGTGNVGKRCSWRSFLKVLTNL